MEIDSVQLVLAPQWVAVLRATPVRVTNTDQPRHEEVLHDDHDGGYHFTNECGNLCYLTGDDQHGVEFRLFRRKDTKDA